MNHPYKRAAQGLLALSASALLIACGSGNNITAATPPTNVPGTDVPIDATQDSTAAFNFVAMVVAMGEADTATPLVLGDAELAVSDTADAMPVAA
ncbi:hypothetical protein [Variovorax sp. PCZ-1]|uniref:hypothetical protein n=1 Tax=Variovorax sp. PCZ-1 TaxID=2835533 RepID=UPI001BCEEABF|nr:hypothetical protein [Variovorax sp. PCZ-1]MBS7807225.1 hypothetical protein [Variovorax sp. PCZ-1]